MASNPLADVERSFVQFGSAPKQIFVTDRRLDLHRAAMRDYEARRRAPADYDAKEGCRHAGVGTDDRSGSSLRQRSGAV
jgi:hypothetical protein